MQCADTHWPRDSRTRLTRLIDAAFIIRISFRIFEFHGHFPIYFLSFSPLFSHPYTSIFLSFKFYSILFIQWLKCWHWRDTFLHPPIGKTRSGNHRRVSTFRRRGRSLDVPTGAGDSRRLSPGWFWRMISLELCWRIHGRYLRGITFNEAGLDFDLWPLEYAGTDRMPVSRGRTRSFSIHPIYPFKFLVNIFPQHEWNQNHNNKTWRRALNQLDTIQSAPPANKGRQRTFNHSSKFMLSINHWIWLQRNHKRPPARCNWCGIQSRIGSWKQIDQSKIIEQLRVRHTPKRRSGNALTNEETKQTRVDYLWKIALIETRRRRCGCEHQVLNQKLIKLSMELSG